MKRRAAMHIVLFATILVSVTAAQAEDKFRYPEDKHGRGELRYVNGVPILLVQGEPSEIGEQIGTLALKPLVDANKELIDPALRDKWFGPVVAAALKTAALMLPQIPPDHATELDAMARAGGLPRDLLIAGNTLPEMILPNVGRLFQCSTLVVEAERSATGTPLFGRNFDQPPIGQFPVHEYTLVTVYRPNGKRAFASIGLPGMFGVSQGMNDAGLTLAGLTVTETGDGSQSLNVTGASSLCGIRRVLEECATVDEAERLLRPFKPTTMSNIAICDTHRGAVFEATTKQLVVRRSVDAICACTNHFRTRELAVDMTCSRYDILDTCRRMKRLDLADVAEKMDEVGNDSTLQSMIFEPAKLRLHLAYGPGPASQYPKTELDFPELFSEGNFPFDHASAKSEAPRPPRVNEIEKGTYDVIFRYRPVGPIKASKAVYLAGTFNNWEPTGQKMSGPDKDGNYETTVQLGGGRHEYKFVIDGERWRPDPNNSTRSGTDSNSVIEVGQ